MQPSPSPPQSDPRQQLQALQAEGAKLKHDAAALERRKHMATTEEEKQQILRELEQLHVRGLEIARYILHLAHLISFPSIAYHLQS